MKLPFLFILMILTAWGPTAAQSGTTRFASLEFRNVGPSRGGRVTAVAGIASRPAEFYMGATGGGVWKTTDYGSTWKNVSDGFFATGSIGAIQVSESHPDVVYVGTGSDGIRSNIILGKGVYRSDDAGTSWRFLGLREAGQIGAVLIHPADPDICYIAAIGNPFGPNPERGVFKTTNGGKDWERVLYISDSTGICDLEFAPGNPDIVYAAAWTVCRKPWTILSGSTEGGIYRSKDGGGNWTRLTGGLPGGIVGKSDLAVCLSKPGYLYVLMEAADGQGGLFLSENGGDNFSRISDRPSLLDRPFYYTNVDVDPIDPDIIHVNSTAYWVSTDRGASWERRSTPHGDNHDMWINPLNPDILIQSNDGGANVSRDGGRTWSSQDNQPTAELYQVNVDDQFVYWLYAGQQDNSTVAIASDSRVDARRNGPSFLAVGGCETGPAVPKPGNPDIVYSNCKGQFGVYDKTTGIERKYWVGAQNMYGHNPKDLKYRFQRVSPILVSRHDPDVVYHCSQFVHRTVDEGVTWETISPDLTANEPDKQVISGGPITRDITGEEFYSTIYAIDESPVKKGVLWVGANDGPVHVTRDGGKTWTNVTPKDLPPGGRVQTVEPSPHDPAKAYITVYRFMLNDWQPYVYMTRDYGKTWKRLTNGSNGIPAGFPVRVVREDPGREGLLFAGTEFGLFLSFDDGDHWEPFQQNLPVVPVTDIKIYRNDLILSTMGRSFWILDDLLPLHDLDQVLTKPQDHLFTPRDAYRSAATRGAILDYYLADTAAQATLTINGKNGERIREIRISGDPGFHRVLWDLRITGEEAASPRRGPSGVKVVPGSYRVRLEANGQIQEKKLEILPDPRLIAKGMKIADYQEQQDITLKVLRLQSDARLFTRRVDTLLAGYRTKSADGKDFPEPARKEIQTLTRLRSQLVTASGPYPQPMLNDQISYLLNLVSGVDQKPGRDAWVRLDELTKQLELLKKELQL